MKHRPYLILIVVFCYLQGQASPNKAGLITYKHIAGLTYEASIITYIQANSPVDPHFLTIEWGDGTTEVVGKTSQEVVDLNFKKNVYTKRHTYGSHGIYTISTEDANRATSMNVNAGNPNSFPFYIESQLVIPAASDYNNSIELLNDPVLTTEVGQVFSYTPATYDADGDLLTFELVTPKRNNNSTVPNYQFVNELGVGPNNQYVFDVLTGTLRWTTPQIPGLYTITMKVSECRNGKMMGAVFVDYQVNVVHSLHVANDHLTATSSTTTIAPNDTVLIHFTYTGSPADSIDLQAYSECFINGNTAVLTIDSTSTNYLGKTVQWIPSASDARCAPYIITLRASTFLANEKFNLDRSCLYYVRTPNMAYCDTICNGSTSTALIKAVPLPSVQIAPNPFNRQTTIQLLGDLNTDDYTFSLFNIWGQRVRYIPSIVEGRITINREKLPAGVYIYKIGQESDEISTGKLIISD